MTSDPYGRDEELLAAIDKVKASPGYDARALSLRRLRELHTYVREVLPDEPPGMTWTVAAELFAKLFMQRNPI